MFTENLDQFFNDFAVAARLTLSGGATRSLSVIFSQPTEAVQLYDSSVEAAAPFLRCKTADLAGVRRGNKITVDGVTYTVERITADGAGTSRLFLKT